MQTNVLRESQEDGARFFSVWPSEWQDKEKKAQMKTQEVPSEFGEKKITVRVTEHLNMVSRETMESPCPEVFKTLLDVILCNLL